MKTRPRRGAVLLQVLVMSVILSMLAVMVMKWILERHLLAVRIQKSSVNFGNAQGYAAKNQSTWGTPPDASAVMDSKQVSFKQTGTPQKFVTTVSD